MAGFSITVPGDFGNTGWATGDALVRNEFVSGAANAFVLDGTRAAGLFQDEEGTIPVSSIGDEVRFIRDRSGQGRHAILRAGANGIPTWLGPSGGIQVPLASGFVVSNPLPLSSWSIIAGVALKAVSNSGTSFPIISQGGASGSTEFLALQMSRVSGKVGLNVMVTAGHEAFSAQDMDLNAPHVIEAVKNMGVEPNSAAITLDGQAGTAYTGTFTAPTPSSVPQTELFHSSGNGLSVSGQLYYIAFVRAVRDTAALAQIAARKAGVTFI